jgi:hypothetical protein
MKTSELTGAALDWAVAKCEGYRDANDPEEHATHEEALDKYNWAFMREPGVAAVWLLDLQYSTHWFQGGPIIEREFLHIHGSVKSNGDTDWCSLKVHETKTGCHKGHGPTPLIAAMRCYVASKLGDDVTLPDGLV